jgi:hypothetical protein
VVNFPKQAEDEENGIDYVSARADAEGEMMKIQKMKKAVAGDALMQKRREIRVRFCGRCT